MPERTRPDLWRELLTRALRLTDSLPGAGYGPLAFRFGGGTVLAFALHHRISNDIDLFIDDAQALGFLSPRLNGVAARLADEYLEQANAIKLVMPDGDIDFIVAGNVTREPADEMLDFDGRAIPLEPIAEILAKKLLYRGASFKPRDVFDLAAALALRPEAAAQALDATRSVLPVVRQRLVALRQLGEARLTADIELTEAGREHAAGMVDRVEAAIEHLA